MSIRDWILVLAVVGSAGGCGEVVGPDSPKLRDLDFVLPPLTLGSIPIASIASSATHSFSGVLGDEGVAAGGGDPDAALITDAWSLNTLTGDQLSVRARTVFWGSSGGFDATTTITKDGSLLVSYPFSIHHSFFLPLVGIADQTWTVPVPSCGITTSTATTHVARWDLVNSQVQVSSSDIASHPACGGGNGTGGGGGGGGATVTVCWFMVWFDEWGNVLWVDELGCYEYGEWET